MIRTSLTLKNPHGHYKYLSQRLSDKICLISRLRLSQESRGFCRKPAKDVGCIYTLQHQKSWEHKVQYCDSDVLETNRNKLVDQHSQFREKMEPIHDEVGLMN